MKNVSNGYAQLIEGMYAHIAYSDNTNLSTRGWMGENKTSNAIQLLKYGVRVASPAIVLDYVEGNHLLTIVKIYVIRLHVHNIITYAYNV